MRVILQREWRGLRMGRVVDMPAGQADMLRRRGIVAAEADDDEDTPAAPRKPRRQRA